MWSRTVARRGPALVGLALAALTLASGAVNAGAAIRTTTVDLCAATKSDLDLNGDGYDDAVVGDPYAMVNGQREAGTITVLYGDADGRIGEGNRVLMTQSGVVGSSVEAGDHFGWSIAIEDATGDGCADILVGSPGEDWQGHVDAGTAQLISFTPDGTGGMGQVHRNVLDQSDVGGAVETGDEFGYAVALSNHRGSDEATGAIGAPGEDLRGVVDAGVVNEFSYQSVAYLATQREQGRGGARWLLGVPEAGDRFGATLEVAPLQVTDGTDVGIEPVTLAGAPGDTVHRAGGGAVDNAGSVTTWDQVTGFQQLITQDSPGVPGVAEPGDHFGASIACSQTSTDPGANRKVAVGAPGEDVGKVQDAGSVTLLDDVERSGLGARVALTQNSPGFAGHPEAGDRFGQSVAMRPDPSEALLLVGVPDEDIGTVVDAGMTQAVSIASGTGAVTATTSYTENRPGTPGAVARGNRFGLTVAAVQGTAESLFAMASPYYGAGSVFLVDDRGDPRSWVPARSTVTETSRFGWAVAGLESS